MATPPVSSPTLQSVSSSSQAGQAAPPPRAAFLQVLRAQLDDRIGQEIFVPLWEAMLRDCEVEAFVKDNDTDFRLVLASSYEAANERREGKTWLLEKEIVMQFHPDNYQIIFPVVKKAFDENGTIDFKTKRLNAIWAWETYMWSVYTGVGYSLRWDASLCKFVSDNANDAPSVLQGLATPRIKTLNESLEEWNIRQRRPV